jgi:hypothetical protein
MTTFEQEHEHKPNVFLRVLGCLGILVVTVGIFVFGISQLRQQARLALERSREEWRQRAFDAVKQGDSSALVMDSKLLPMLANDADCRRIVTSLAFASTEIDSSDAGYVAELRNVTSMTFYCTRGTKDLLLAAQELPISDLRFEMPDLPVEHYLILKDFPHLKKVRFEHVMDDEWIDRLKSEMPSVIVDAPFPRSREPGFAQ